jgi:hypothetical protein
MWSSRIPCADFNPAAAVFPCLSPHSVDPYTVARLLIKTTLL